MENLETARANVGELDVAKAVQQNLKAEAEAIIDYTSLIDLISKSDLEEQDKENAINVISELIADELNHEIKLSILYNGLTGIETKKD